MTDTTTADNSTVSSPAPDVPITAANMEKLAQERHGWIVRILVGNFLAFIAAIGAVYFPMVLLLACGRLSFQRATSWWSRSDSSRLEPASMALALSAVVLTLWISVVLTPGDRREVQDPQRLALHGVLTTLATTVTMVASSVCWLLSVWALGNPALRPEIVITTFMAITLATLSVLRREDEIDRLRWQHQALAVHKRLTTSSRGRAAKNWDGTGGSLKVWATAVTTCLVACCVLAGVTYARVAAVAPNPAREGFFLTVLLTLGATFTAGLSLPIYKWRDRQSRDTPWRWLPYAGIWLLWTLQVAVVLYVLGIVGEVREWNVSHAYADHSPSAVITALSTIAAGTLSCFAPWTMARSGALDPWFNRAMTADIERAQQRVQDLASGP